MADIEEYVDVDIEVNGKVTESPLSLSAKDREEWGSIVDILKSIENTGNKGKKQRERVPPQQSYKRMPPLTENIQTTVSQEQLPVGQGMQQLDHLLRLMEQMCALQRQNTRLREHTQYLTAIKTLQEMRNESLIQQCSCDMHRRRSGRDLPNLNYDHHVHEAYSEPESQADDIVMTRKRRQPRTEKRVGRAISRDGKNRDLKKRSKSLDPFGDDGEEYLGKERGRPGIFSKFEKMKEKLTSRRGSVKRRSGGKVYDDESKREGDYGYPADGIETKSEDSGFCQINSEDVYHMSRRSEHYQRDDDLSDGEEVFDNQQGLSVVSLQSRLSRRKVSDVSTESSSEDYHETKQKQRKRSLDMSMLPPSGLSTEANRRRSRFRKSSSVQEFNARELAKLGLDPVKDRTFRHMPLEQSLSMDTEMPNVTNNLQSQNSNGGGSFDSKLGEKQRHKTQVTDVSDRQLSSSPESRLFDPIARTPSPPDKKRNKGWDKVKHAVAIKHLDGTLTDSPPVNMLTMYENIQANLSNDFLSKLEAWDRKKHKYGPGLDMGKQSSIESSSSDPAGLYSPELEVEMYQNLSEDFTKKLAEWDRKKKATSSSPKGDRKQKTAEKKEKKEKSKHKEEKTKDETAKNKDGDKVPHGSRRVFVIEDEEGLVKLEGASKDFEEKYLEWERMHRELEGKAKKKDTSKVEKMPPDAAQVVKDATQSELLTVKPDVKEHFPPPVQPVQEIGSQADFAEDVIEGTEKPSPVKCSDSVEPLPDDHIMNLERRNSLLAEKLKSKDVNLKIVQSEIQGMQQQIEKMCGWKGEVCSSIDESSSTNDELKDTKGPVGNDPPEVKGQLTKVKDQPAEIQEQTESKEKTSVIKEGEIKDPSTIPESLENEPRDDQDKDSTLKRNKVKHEDLKPIRHEAATSTDDTTEVTVSDASTERLEKSLQQRENLIRFLQLEVERQRKEINFLRNQGPVIHANFKRAKSFSVRDRNFDSKNSQNAEVPLGKALVKRRRDSPNSTPSQSKSESSDQRNRESISITTESTMSLETLHISAEDIRIDDMGSQIIDQDIRDRSELPQLPEEPPTRFIKEREMRDMPAVIKESEELVDQSEINEAIEKVPEDKEECLQIIQTSQGNGSRIKDADTTHVQNKVEKLGSWSGWDLVPVKASDDEGTYKEKQLTKQMDKKSDDSTKKTSTSATAGVVTDKNTDQSTNNHEPTSKSHDQTGDDVKDHPKHPVLEEPFQKTTVGSIYTEQKRHVSLSPGRQAAQLDTSTTPDSSPGSNHRRKVVTSSGKKGGIVSKQAEKFKELENKAESTSPKLGRTLETHGKEVRRLGDREWRKEPKWKVSVETAKTETESKQRGHNEKKINSSVNIDQESDRHSGTELRRLGDQESVSDMKARRHEKAEERKKDLDTRHIRRKSSTIESSGKIHPETGTKEANTKSSGKKDIDSAFRAAGVAGQKDSEFKSGPGHSSEPEQHLKQRPEKEHDDSFKVKLPAKAEVEKSRDRLIGNSTKVRTRHESLEGFLDDDQDISVKSETTAARRFDPEESLAKKSVNVTGTSNTKTLATRYLEKYDPLLAKNLAYNKKEISSVDDLKKRFSGSASSEESEKNIKLKTPSGKVHVREQPRSGSVKMLSEAFSVTSLVNSHSSNASGGKNGGTPSSSVRSTPGNLSPASSCNSLSSSNVSDKIKKMKERSSFDAQPFLRIATNDLASKSNEFPSLKVPSVQRKNSYRNSMPTLSSVRAKFENADTPPDPPFTSCGKSSDESATTSYKKTGENSSHWNTPRKVSVTVKDVSQDVAVKKPQPISIPASPRTPRIIAVVKTEENQKPNDSADTVTVRLRKKPFSSSLASSSSKSQELRDGVSDLKISEPRWRKKEDQSSSDAPAKASVSIAVKENKDVVNATVVLPKSKTSAKMTVTVEDKKEDASMMMDEECSVQEQRQENICPKQTETTKEACLNISDDAEHDSHKSSIKEKSNKYEGKSKNNEGKKKEKGDKNEKDSKKGSKSSKKEAKRRSESESDIKNRRIDSQKSKTLNVTEKKEKSSKTIKKRSSKKDIHKTDKAATSKDGSEESGVALKNNKNSDSVPDLIAQTPKMRNSLLLDDNGNRSKTPRQVVAESALRGAVAAIGHALPDPVHLGDEEGEGKDDDRRSRKDKARRAKMFSKSDRLSKLDLFRRARSVDSTKNSRDRSPSLERSGSRGHRSSSVDRSSPPEIKSKGKDPPKGGWKKILKASKA